MKSYMSAHVLFNLLNELRKSDEMQGVSSILWLFFAASFIDLIMHLLSEHVIIRHKNCFEIAFWYENVNVLPYMPYIQQATL